MARNTKPKGKIVRRLGVNVYGNAKYDRLLKKKPQKPGLERGQIPRRRESDFSKQLVEKQKLRFTYEIGEKQFYNVYTLAKRMKGPTGDNMMILLEERLDNVVYRLGMAGTRVQARQLVSHGHIRLNGGRSTIPSMRVKSGDEILIRDSESSKKLIRSLLAKSGHPLPPWLSLSSDDLKGRVERIPARQDIPSVANEQIIVEYYSR